MRRKTSEHFRPYRFRRVDNHMHEPFSSTTIKHRDTSIEEIERDAALQCVITNNLHKEQSP